jgi:hypothetical protein
LQLPHTSPISGTPPDPPQPRTVTRINAPP